MRRCGWMAALLSTILLCTTSLVMPTGAEGADLAAGQRRSTEGQVSPVPSLSEKREAAALTESPTPPRPVPVRLEGLVVGIQTTQDALLLTIASSAVATRTLVLVGPETPVRPIGLSPAVQDYVTVQAILHPDGSLVATYVRIRTEDEWVNQNQLEFRGLITAGPQTTKVASGAGLSDVKEEWAIGGRLVRVDGKDIIGTPAVGKYAHVKGLLGRDGVIKATWMQVWDPAEVAAQFQFEGAIQAGPPDLGIWTIDGVQGVVDENTVVEGVAEIGAVAEVRGRRAADGTALFESIRILAQREREVRFEGLVVDYDIQKEAGLVEGHLALAGQRVEVNGMTFIDESGGRLDRGMWAEVVARWEGRLLYALRIIVSRPE